jgi:glycosyltransferase involved in cell wall biosynthesis
MNFDFYLSEMSVSDLHGGGLTLQRVLGDDLSAIKRYVYVDRFANDLPASSKYADKGIYIEPLWQTDYVRKIMGRSVAALLGKKMFFIKQYANTAAKVISNKITGKNELNGLICPQGANSILVLEALKQRRRVKYITWIMDDHLLEFKEGEWVYPAGIGRIFKNHLQQAEHVFVISPAMQKFYQERFDVQSTVLFGSSDMVNGIPQSVTAADDGLKIGYFGAVAGWQLDALVAATKAAAGKNIQIHIYSGIQTLPDALNLPGVQFKGKLKPDEVLATMRNYNAVLLPLSFTEKFRNMSQFNIATKMSEYLASGVPIVALGPPYAAMINYLEDNNAAIVISSTEVDKINKGLELLNNKEHIIRVLNNAQKLVKAHTGTLPMHKNWASIINN